MQLIIRNKCFPRLSEPRNEPQWAGEIATELSGRRFHQPEGIWENKPIPQGLQTFPWSAFNDYEYFNFLMFPAWRARHRWQTDAPNGDPEIKAIPEEHDDVITANRKTEPFQITQVITASVMFYLTTADVHVVLSESFSFIEIYSETRTNLMFCMMLHSF